MGTKKKVIQKIWDVILFFILLYIAISIVLSIFEIENNTRKIHADLILQNIILLEEMTNGYGDDEGRTVEEIDKYNHEIENSI